MVSGVATSLDGAKALQRRPKLHGAGAELENKKIRCLFDRALKEICRRSNIKHLSPTIAGGQYVDLFKLFLIVRKNGGFIFVSGNGIWDLVAKKCGSELGTGASVKLMYGKYLDMFERWLSTAARKTNSDADVSECLMGLEEQLKELLSDIFSDNWEKIKGNLNMDSKILELEKTDGKYPQADSTCKLNFKNHGSTHGVAEVQDTVETHGSKDSVDVGGGLLLDPRNVRTIADVEELQQKEKEVISDLILEGKLTLIEESSSLKIKCIINSSDVSIPSNEDGTTMSDREMPCDNDEPRGEEAVESDGEKNKNLQELYPATAEDISNRKRKRDSSSRMVRWVTELAKNPRYPVASSPSVKSIWKASGREHWKPLLLAREAMFLNQQMYGIDQKVPQIKRRMHPFMFDDQSESGHGRLGRRKSKLSGKMTSQADGHSESSAANSKNEDYSRLRVRLGKNYQAVVPEWTGLISDSDTKWLGTRVWPQDVKHRNVIEMDPIGAGRQDACNCGFQGSIECVRFHIAEKKLKLKLDLGPTFYLWRFDKMGEEVELSWTNKEVNKFRNIISLNRPSNGKCFWNEIVKGFRNKSWQDLVSYYYNVFLLGCRAYQNRGVPLDMDSDDDCEACFGK